MKSVKGPFTDAEDSFDLPDPFQHDAALAPWGRTGDAVSVWSNRHIILKVKPWETFVWKLK